MLFSCEIFISYVEEHNKHENLPKTFLGKWKKLVFHDKLKMVGLGFELIFVKFRRIYWDLISFSVNWPKLVHRYQQSMRNKQMGKEHYHFIFVKLTFYITIFSIFYVVIERSDFILVYSFIRVPYCRSNRKKNPQHLNTKIIFFDVSSSSSSDQWRN